MDTKWMKIFSTADQFDAEMKKGLLVTNGIEAVIVSKKDSFYHLGELEIHVRMDDIMRAKYILNTTAGE